MKWSYLAPIEDFFPAFSPSVDMVDVSDSVIESVTRSSSAQLASAEIALYVPKLWSFGPVSLPW